LALNFTDSSAYIAAFTRIKDFNAAIWFHIGRFPSAQAYRTEFTWQDVGSMQRFVFQAE